MMIPEHGGPIVDMQPALAGLATVSAALAIIILLWFLIRRPPFVPIVKVLLLLGFGVFPIIAAFTGNAASYQHSSTGSFCGSCHVMEPWIEDALDPESLSLPAIHSRNARFGGQSCYTCHADYGMFGTLLTKLGGLGHVWEYYTEYHAYTIEEAVPLIELRRPFSNDVCMDCHSTFVPSWTNVADHRGIADETRSGEASCMSAGCHGPAHAFSKTEEELAAMPSVNLPPPPDLSPPAEPAPEPSAEPSAEPTEPAAEVRP